MSEGDSVSSGFSQAFVDNIVKVSDIPSTTTQEALVIYFQSEASSGGGEVVQNGCVRLNDNQALVVFTEKRSKQRVLSRDHVLNDTQLKVTPFPDTGEEVPHAKGGSGSHHGYGLWDSPLLGSFQMCHPHFENPWSKGTPTDGVNYSYGNGHSYHQVMNTNDVVNYPPMADVSSIWTDTPSKVENFIPAESADGALAEQETSHGYLSINEIENVTPPPGFGEKCKPHERRLLEVTGFKDGTTTEMIELFFENKKKSGGGDIKDFQFDVDKNKAFIEFDDPKDLESVLNKTELVLGGTRIKVKVYAPKPKTAVSVTGMREGTTMETLELYFENPKRSKGDDVKTIRMNEAQTVAVIDYGSVEVAERVAAKKDHVLSNASLTVIQCSPDDESEAEEMSSEDEDSSSDGDYQQTEQLPMTAIRVTNFNPETPDETLVLFFESPKRCGGGEILSIRVNEERTVAVIDYGSVEVAERVATTSELIIDRSLVAVNACCPDVSVEPISSEAGLAVDVSGFKPSSTEEMIKHFFENKKKSRGGPILSMKLLEDVDPRTYRIVFQKSDDAIRVLKKKNLRLDSAELIVAVASDAGRNQAHTCATSVLQSEHPDQAQPVTTIRVSGLPKDTSHDLLECFFENRSKSGGGKIDKIEIDEAKQTALVTFADSSAADRVYQNRLSLQLNKTPIDVELVQPPKPKKKLPLDPYKLVVSNIPEDASYELLLYYIGNHSRCDVDAIRYGEKPGLGIVIFEQVPDIHKLLEACTKKPLQKSVLQIEPVYLTDSIQVHDLPPNCTDDTLENYFENKKKSGGGEVENVVIHRNGKVAVITFADHTDVQRVIEKKHKVSKCVLKVCEYYEQVGLRHPDDDSSKPVARIPDDAVVGPFDVSLVKFVCSSLECRQLLDNELRRHHGRANWETSTADSLVVTCFLSSSEQLAEMAWENVVKTAVVNFFTDYKTESIDILQHIWTDLVPRLSSHANGKVLVETIEEGHAIRLTGVRSIVDEVLNKVNEDRKILEEEFNRKSQEVTETLTTLKDFELLFLQEMKFGVSGCKCEIDVKKKHIQFIGIPLDVNKAKSDMYEILRNLTSEKVVSTPVILRLLKNPECHQYIYSQFRSSNVAASWTATDTDISVFASDKNVSRKAAQIMSRELHEALVSLQAESKPLLTGSQWKSAKESQLTQYRGCLEIVEHSDLTQLTIAGTGSVTANVLEVVQDFFESNTIYEGKIRLSSGKFRFMEQYNETGIVQIQESLKSHHVSIRFVADSTSIDIKGTKKGVELTQRKISNLMCKVIWKNIEIAEPGMDEFFNCQRGKSFLETVERKNKCIIVIGEDDVCDEESEGAMQHHNGSGDVMCEVKKYGKTFKVIQGDMTKHKVDVIVNAANGELKNVGGLALAIVKQGGNCIQEECNGIIERQGTVLPGKTATTGSGNLPCKKVVHVVGTQWSGGNHNETKYLFQGIINALKATEKESHKSLAIPAVGTSIFGVPLKVSVLTIVEAVVDYFGKNQRSVIREVHFLDNRMGNVQEFAKAVKSKIGQLSSTSFSGATMLPQAATSATIGGLSVRVFQGDITKQATGAIVNPCNSDLDLSMGAWTSTVGSGDDEEGVPRPTPQLLETNLRIFGSKDSDITNAIEEIKKLCKDELCDVVMDGSLNKEYAAIRLLTKDEIATARAIDLKHHVRIDLNERIHRIRIRGRTECVLKAKDEIKQILHSADQRNILEEQAELLAKHVQWIFEENQEWALYSSMSNLKIEQAYSKRESKVKFSENGFDCEIDFGRMMEHVSWKVPVPVQRVEKAAVAKRAAYRKQELNIPGSAVTAEVTVKLQPQVFENVRATVTKKLPADLKEVHNNELSDFLEYLERESHASKIMEEDSGIEIEGSFYQVQNAHRGLENEIAKFLAVDQKKVIVAEREQRSEATGKFDRDGNEVDCGDQMTSNHDTATSEKPTRNKAISKCSITVMELKDNRDREKDCSEFPKDKQHKQNISDKVSEPKRRDSRPNTLQSFDNQKSIDTNRQSDDSSISTDENPPDDISEQEKVISDKESSQDVCISLPSFVQPFVMRRFKETVLEKEIQSLQKSFSSKIWFNFKKNVCFISRNKCSDSLREKLDDLFSKVKQRQIFCGSSGMRLKDLTRTAEKFQNMHKETCWCSYSKENQEMYIVTIGDFPDTRILQKKLNAPEAQDSYRRRKNQERFASKQYEDTLENVEKVYEQRQTPRRDRTEHFPK